jgi:hypothetical protein
LREYKLLKKDPHCQGISRNIVVKLVPDKKGFNETQFLFASALLCDHQRNNTMNHPPAETTDRLFEISYGRLFRS